MFVADAGANALFEVKPNGAISVVATFPVTANPAGCTLPGASPQPGPPTSESVPTTVVRGPDGALYVGELTGFPFCAGSARIWRIAPGGKPAVWRSGLKMIIDMDFARDGSLYVLQFASSPSLPGGPGQIVRFRRNGARQVLDLGERLQQPGGLAVGPEDGALYVTNSIGAPGTGEVLRIVP